MLQTFSAVRLRIVYKKTKNRIRSATNAKARDSVSFLFEQSGGRWSKRELQPVGSTAVSSVPSTRRKQLILSKQKVRGIV